MPNTPTHCSYCNQPLKHNYQRQISVAGLFFIHELTEQFWLRKQSIHYQEISDRVRKHWKRNPSDYATLKYFDLIKPDEEKSGFYKPTRLAYDFLMGVSAVAKYYYDSSNEFGPERINVFDILENPPKPNWRITNP